jgi:hypothetical protein
MRLSEYGRLDHYFFMNTSWIHGVRVGFVKDVVGTNMVRKRLGSSLSWTDVCKMAVGANPPVLEYIRFKTA